MLVSGYHEEIFFTTVKISISNETDPGKSAGTGFLVRIPLPMISEHHFAIVLISNKHVFKDPNNRMEFNLNKKDPTENPDLGNVETIQSLGFTTHYIEHPNPDIDLACVIAPVL